MSFLQLAEPFLAVQIPVFPLVARKKEPLTSNGVKDATTDINQVKAWSDQYGECNIGIAAPTGGDICFLEFDIKGGLTPAANEMGHLVPTTRTQASGRGFAHYIFKHTERSRALGNRSVNLHETCTCAEEENRTCLRQGCNVGSPHHHHEWFSFRASNKYLVGAGSIHPNGTQYANVRDVAHILIPDWVCEWIEKNSTAAPRKKLKGALSVSDDFDFDDLMDFYGIDILGIKDEVWHVPTGCMGVGGRQHDQSLFTAFYWDGNSLGWNCFAQGCPLFGMTIGQVIKFLNEQKGEPYKGAIWEHDDKDGFAIEDAEMSGDMLEPIEVSNLVSLPAVAIAPQIQVTLEMPHDCMYGELAVLAKQCDVALGLVYPALIAAHSAKIVTDEMCSTRTNIYCGLITPPGGGKNQSIDRSLQILELLPKLHYSKSIPAGDSQLAQILGDKAPDKRGKERNSGPKRMLLVNNELTDVLKKTSVDNSTLASRLCDLWDDNYFEKMVGKENFTVNCRLSWLGGIPAGKDATDRFTELFGGETNFGLYPRFIFGYTSEKFKWREWKPRQLNLTTSIGDDESSDLDTLAATFPQTTYVTGFADGAYELWENWEETEIEDFGRIKYNAKKVAVLTASASHEAVVSLKCMETAIRFMQWQMRLRLIFKPGEAKNQQAECRGVILDGLKSVGADENFVSWKTWSSRRKWGVRFNDWMVIGCIKNLIEVREIVEHPSPAKQGKVMLNPILTGNEWGKKTLEAANVETAVKAAAEAKEKPRYYSND